MAGSNDAEVFGVGEPGVDGDGVFFRNGAVAVAGISATAWATRSASASGRTFGHGPRADEARRREGGPSRRHLPGRLEEQRPGVESVALLRGPRLPHRRGAREGMT